jgi:DNA mismatch repair protein MutS
MSESASIYGDYIQITKTYQQKYGGSTVLLMQVGAFFEVYGFKCPRTGDIQDSAILEFSQICNLNISEKKVVYEGRQVLMAGFRDYTLDKYLQKITEQGYTAVVYVQEKTGKTITRVLDSVHSAGTYVSYETDNLPQMTNNIMCVWIDVFKPTARIKAGGSKTRDSIICGIAVANTFTGKSSLSEFQHSFEMNPTTFDDLERAVIVNNPSEVILVTGLPDQIVNSIVQFSGIRTSVIHRVSSETSEKAAKCAQQKYVQHILDTFYGEESLQTCGEFSMYPTATQAFCYLLDFVQEHNPNLVKKIAVPGFQSSKKMLLANHTLKQLNILDDANQDGKKKGHLASVATFLNKCCTAMGKRKFQSQLVAPTTDIEWLNQEYAMTARMLETDAYDMMDSVRKILGQIRDIEKICRQIVLRKIYPSSIYQLYESVLNAHQLAICFAELPEILGLLSSNGENNIRCLEVLGFLDENLYMDRCKLVSSWQNLEESVVKPGVCIELDEAVNSYQKNVKRFQAIHTFFNRIMRKQDPSDTTEYVKVHETEKSGVTLQITKKRATALKAELANMGSLATCEIPGSDISISVRDVKFISASGSADELEIPILSKICKEMIYQKEALNRWNIAAYHQVLTKFENEWYTALEQIAEQIAKLDVLQSKAYIAKTYHYCRPEIIASDEPDNNQSFVDARDLRHCLIEHIQQNEIYVPNDVSLGNISQDGILLYGTNAVGKTSLIRALGIAVIMAQAGLYTPCSKFTYKPYTAIFSRILGNDNLFKGLSTFAVEMSELRIILKMADQNSLILGDELCSGTEMESALSIFVAGLQNLHEKRASFVFATHFHEIIGYDEIKVLNRLALKHMAVLYDKELDALVYDRKLCDGPGTRMYGLEVCKSLHLEDEFLEKAYAIRAKYFAKSELDHQTSKYNAKKIRGLCELCKTEIGEEIHHLDPQKNADQDGFIGAFHKNHPANLMTVCEKCHDKFHQGISTGVMIKKKSTRGFIATTK